MHCDSLTVTVPTPTASGELLCDNELESTFSARKNDMRGKPNLVEVVKVFGFHNSTHELQA